MDGRNIQAVNIEQGAPDHPADFVLVREAYGVEVHVLFRFARSRRRMKLFEDQAHPLGEFPRRVVRVSHQQDVLEFVHRALEQQTRHEMGDRVRFAGSGARLDDREARLDFCGGDAEFAHLNFPQAAKGAAISSVHLSQAAGSA